MEKNQPFFDPYNFNPQPSPMQHQNIPQDIPMNMNLNLDNPLNPAMYYEQQYMYYRYLTQMIEYKMKLKEWENMQKNNK